MEGININRPIDTPHSQVGDGEIRVTSPLDFAERLTKERSLKVSEEGIESKWIDSDNDIEAKVVANRYQNHYNQYEKSGLLTDEIAYFPRGEIADDNAQRLANAWLENIEAGYLVELVPVFDAKNNVVGNKLYRIKRGNVDQLRKKIALDINFQEEDTHSWIYEEAEKEAQLNNKVKEGKAVYLGELNIEKYYDLRKEVDLQNAEFFGVQVFDDNKVPISGTMKYYAKISS